LAIVSMKQLLEAGVHFGHQTRRWNPKMAPYIFAERNGIYIIDLQKTVRLLEVAYNFIQSVAESGKSILFVGTKKQAQDAIREEALRCGEVCEKCGKKMKIKVGRYGKFLACSGFPECKNTKPILEEIGVNCPECGSPLVKRRSKKGKIFYGCSRYPDCLFVSWDKPINKKCPLCQSLLVEKGKRDGEKKIACSNKNCDYSQNLEEKEEKTLTSEIDSKRKD